MAEGEAEPPLRALPQHHRLRAPPGEGSLRGRVVIRGRPISAARRRLWGQGAGVTHSRVGAGSQPPLSTTAPSPGVCWKAPPGPRRPLLTSSPANDSSQSPIGAPATPSPQPQIRDCRDTERGHASFLESPPPQARPVTSVPSQAHSRGCLTRLCLRDNPRPPRWQLGSRSSAQARAAPGFCPKGC